MPEHDNKIIIIAVVVVVVLIAIWVIHRQGAVEGYISNPLSAIVQMKRTPVTYAFVGDGMSDNPHYQADPSDRLVPLEYGGQKFWDPSPHIMPDPLLRSSNVNKILVNDGKLRLDMVESGDMAWHRFLNNVPHSKYNPKDGRHYDADDIQVDPAQPLYAPIYHYDAFLGQR